MRLIPRSFLGRTILMVLLPLIVAQVIIAEFFFGNHWSRVHNTMARSLSSEITTMMNFIDSDNLSAAKTMAGDIGINVSINKKLNRPAKNDNNSMIAGRLSKHLQTQLMHMTTSS